MGNAASKSDQVGIGTQYGKTDPPAGAPWYYAITDPIITYLIAPLHYWNFYQGCGPFNLSGCEDLSTSVSFIATSNPNGDGAVAMPSAGYMKLFWVLADILGFAAITAIIAIGGFLLTDLSFLLTPFEDIFGWILGLGEDLFGWVFSFLETGATYVLQFFGFAGDLAGQSLFGLGTDACNSLSQMTGIPTFLWYVLLGELLVGVLLKIWEDALNNHNSTSWLFKNCMGNDIFYVLDYPFSWLIDTALNNLTFVQDIFRLMFIPFRILFWLFADVLGEIICNLDPNNSQCPGTTNSKPCKYTIPR